MASFPGDTSYPAHVPPQHAPRLQERKRKQKPPASLSKLHRPLVSYSETPPHPIQSPKKRKIINKNTNPKTRFYCNDCKKKFRSRILANRNNNAVQHYCSLYSKIITRKVDSHSNKCKGDHGMGPCVVKRTDNDPDSDGEDETKAAYYADKGKKRPRKSSGAYTKKRKRETGNDTTEVLNKRQRRNHNNNNTNNNNNNSESGQLYYPPLPMNGYYNNGNMSPNGSGNGYHMNGINNSPPPIMRTGSTPPLGSNYNENNNGNMITQRDRVNTRIDNYIPPPPPPLEEIEPMIVESNEGNDIIKGEDEDNKGEELDKEVFVEVNDNIAGNMIDMNKNTNGECKEDKKEEKEKDDDRKEEVNSKVEEVEDEECINDENTEEDDDLPDLTVPCNSPMPNSNGNNVKENGNDNGNDDNKEEGDQDDDLMLTIPQ